MFIRAKPDSLSVVMVRKYPLTSIKLLFARSLSAEVTGMVQAIRSKHEPKIYLFFREKMF